MRYNELLPKWQHILDRVKIPTWTEPLTLAYLADLASRSTNIIECGTYLGASAKVMLLANPKLTLYCIDTFACVNEPMMLEYLEKIGVLHSGYNTASICRIYSLKEEIHEGRCHLAVGDSRSASKDLFEQNGNQWADAVWVDDGHAEEDVFRDIVCLMPFLKPGGEMVGHDFDGENDVARGVIASGIKFDVPIPRMWRHFEP